MRTSDEPTGRPSSVATERLRGDLRAHPGDRGIGARWRATPRPARGSPRRCSTSLYPPHCLACRAADRGRAGPVCAVLGAACASSSGPFASGSARPFAQDLGVGPALARRHRPPARLSAAPGRWPVSTTGRRAVLIHRLKYGDRPDFARVLGAWMARAGAELLADADVIVPVPLHRRRLWQRRFNQAALLARRSEGPGASRWTRSAGSRVKATASQVGMSRSGARRQRPGRLPVSRRMVPGIAWSARAARRRRAHDGRDRECRGPGSAAGRRSQRRRARLRPGCDDRLTAYIVRRSSAWQRARMAPSPSTRRAPAPIATRPRTCCARRTCRSTSRRDRQAGRAARHDGAGRRAHQRAADLHRRPARRRLRRPLRSRRPGDLDPLLAA